MDAFVWNASVARGRWLAACVGLLIGSGCQHHPLDLAPPDSHPVFRVEVDDGEEVALLRQRLALVPLTVDGRVLHFADANESVERLRALGYSPQRVNAMDAYFRIVEVCRGVLACLVIRQKASKDMELARQRPFPGWTVEESELIARGLTILRRESAVWILRGSLAQLQALQRAGYQLFELSSEPRPRQAVLQLDDRQAAIVIRSGIDIVDSEGDHQRGFVITVRGFEYELDQLRTAGLPLTLID